MVNYMNQNSYVPSLLQGNVRECKHSTETSLASALRDCDGSNVRDRRVTQVEFRSHSCHDSQSFYCKETRVTSRQDLTDCEIVYTIHSSTYIRRCADDPAALAGASACSSVYT